MNTTSRQPLPGLRKDLRLYRGPQEFDGSPTYNLYDPLQGKFYKFGWKESLIFKAYKEGLTADEIAARINHDFPVHYTTEDVEQFFLQLANLGLLKVPASSETLYQAKLKRKQSLWLQFVHHYLFIKIPLLNPDPFLGRTVKYVSFLGSRPALMLYACVAFLAFFQVLFRFDQFWNTFTYFFNLEGLIVYALALTAVKVVHESAHAYTAKHYGLYVPTMGIALLVLWPVLYTDVTEGWKLASRKKRFFISFAGVAAELAVAGFASFGWLFTAPGVWNSIFFVLASSSWLITLSINLNPAVRFDGYYILCDLWGVDNLMPTAFAVTRWKFHGWLFGIPLECPEPNMSRTRMAGFIVYTAYVIIYRIILYTAIALFVYYKFTKVLGIFLFLLEIGIFFIWPVWWEAKMVYRLRQHITLNWRTALAAGSVLLVSCWLILPLPHRMTFDGVLVPESKQVVYAPEEGRIKEVFVARGDAVERGAPLVQLTSRYILKDLAQLLYDKKLLEAEVLALSQEESSKQFIAEKEAALQRVGAQIAELEARKKRLLLAAETAGVVSIWDEDLRPGQYVSQGQEMGMLVGAGGMLASAYVGEKEIAHFHPQQRVTVLIGPEPLSKLPGTVVAVHRARAEQLPYPALASIHQGPLAVVPSAEGERLKLLESYYNVVIELEHPDETERGFGQTLKITMRGPWRSYAWEFIKAAFRAILSETSF